MGVLFFSILHSIVTPEMKMKQNLSALIKLILVVISTFNDLIQEHGAGLGKLKRYPEDLIRASLLSRAFFSFS